MVLVKTSRHWHSGEWPPVYKQVPGQSPLAHRAEQSQGRGRLQGISGRGTDVRSNRHGRGPQGFGQKHTLHVVGKGRCSRLGDVVPRPDIEQELLELGSGHPLGDAVHYPSPQFLWKHSGHLGQ